MTPVESAQFLGSSTPPGCTSLMEEISNALDYKLLATPVSENPPVLMPQSSTPRAKESPAIPQPAEYTGLLGLPFPGRGDGRLPEPAYIRRQSRGIDYLGGPVPDLSLTLERPNSICTTYALKPVDESAPLSVSQKKRHSLNFWSRHRRYESSTITYSHENAPKRSSRLFSRVK